MTVGGQNSDERGRRKRRTEGGATDVAGGDGIFRSRRVWVCVRVGGIEEERKRRAGGVEEEQDRRQRAGRRQGERERERERERRRRRRREQKEGRREMGSRFRSILTFNEPKNSPCHPKNPKL